VLHSSKCGLRNLGNAQLYFATVVFKSAGTMAVLIAQLILLLGSIYLCRNSFTHPAMLRTSTTLQA
jgi:hypothetical protein